MRDALVATSTLDIFNRNADKVIMGNIAQTINVLQAMILTDGDKMVTTPTYHVYDMYQSHQGGTCVRALFESQNIAFTVGGKEERIFGLDGSASVKGNELTLTVVNPHATDTVEAEVVLRGGSARAGSAAVLTDQDIHAHNTFDAPDAVRPVASAATIAGHSWRYTFAPASVTAIKVQLG